ncbi:MAG: DDE-type integrase/transposase/recombinase [Fusobacteriaceae bacterium]
MLEKIVEDIAYIKTKDFRWCYLASFLDLHISEIIGWEFSQNMTTELVLKALKKANGTKELSGAIIHTDQGSQYTNYQSYMIF